MMPLAVVMFFLTGLGITGWAWTVVAPGSQELLAGFSGMLLGAGIIMGVAALNTLGKER